MNIFRILTGAFFVFLLFLAPVSHAQDVNAIVNQAMDQANRAVSQSMGSTTGVTPTGTTFINTTLRDQKQDGNDFKNSGWTNVKIEAGSYNDANFEGAVLMNVEFHNVSLRNANFKNASLTNVKFYSGDLRGVNIAGARMMNVTFLDRAKLHGVDFSQAASTMNVNYNDADFDTADVVSSGTIAETLQRAPTNDKYNKKANINLAILFEFDSDKISPASWDQLQELSKALSDTALENSNFLIEGHTDAKGSDEYNADLSYRRAFAIRKALVDQLSVNASRLTVKGYGESRPVADNETDYGRAQNRRVTVVNLGQ